MRLIFAAAHHAAVLDNVGQHPSHQPPPLAARCRLGRHRPRVLRCRYESQSHEVPLQKSEKRFKFAPADLTPRLELRQSDTALRAAELTEKPDFRRPTPGRGTDP